MLHLETMEPEKQARLKELRLKGLDSTMGSSKHTVRTMAEEITLREASNHSQKLCGMP